MTAETNTILLKACPRCRGDLIYDPCEKQRLCLQCGHRLSRRQERELFGTNLTQGQHGAKKTGPPDRGPDHSRLGVTVQL